MKALSQSEISQIAIDLQQHVGWFLQEIVGSESHLGMKLYGGASVWLWIDLNPATPLLLTLHKIPDWFQKQKKPIHQFLHTHGRGMRLVQLRVEAAMGRVLTLEFAGGPKTVRVTVSFIPHFANVEVRVSDPGDEPKSVFWRKPKELPSKRSDQPLEIKEPPAVRRLSELAEQWGTKKGERKASTEIKDSVLQFQAELERKKRILSQLQRGSNQNEEGKWRQLGDKLKVGGFAGLTKDELNELESRNLAQEINFCFSQAKKAKEKMHGNQERLLAITEEIARDEALLAANDVDEMSARLRRHNSTAKNKPRESDARKNYRTYLSSNSYEVRIGKSGVDNLALLREAQPWFLWLHVRDAPGSFGIIPMQKGTELPRADLLELAHHVVIASLPVKQRSAARGRFEVLCAQCRFVRPMKSAKPGMVTYSDESVLVVDLR
jgi:hypothetical protein